MNSQNTSQWIVASILLLLLTGVSLAQDGKLAIQATPKQAYVFVDGHAMGQATHTYSLSPGDHKVDLANYGYKSASQTVSITAGETAHIQMDLTPLTDTVSGPWGAMTIEGADHNAILLNGKTPDFFVGHGDEFDHEWGWKQELVVPPGNYQVTVLGRDKEIWSGPVDVPADQRAVVDVPKGVRKTVPWSRGQKLSSTHRFSVGTASATVAVAKPTAELAASASQINCGDSSQLKWASTDAPQVAITPVGSVTTSGEQAVQPTTTRTYDLKAVGPGGTATSTATVNVNNAIQANLTLSPSEIRYKRVGDQIVEQGNPTVTWTASNDGSVSIDPIGGVNTNGSQAISGVPRKTDAGPVDETVTYTLNATNTCGGTTTQTATLHISGVIEAAADLAFNSIYFPTDAPRSTKDKEGLVASQQTTLNTVADAFKKYLQSKPDAHLILAGHADKRGPGGYNKDLSERRAEVTKAFLVEQGVPAENLEIQANGKDNNLSNDQVKELVEQNQALGDEEKQQVLEKMHTIVLANNRRVDLVLSATGKESTREYPFKADDYSVLVDRNGEKREGVQLASEKKKLENQ